MNRNCVPDKNICSKFGHIVFSSQRVVTQKNDNQMSFKRQAMSTQKHTHRERTRGRERERERVTVSGESHRSTDQLILVTKPQTPLVGSSSPPQKPIWVSITVSNVLPVSPGAVLFSLPPKTFLGGFPLFVCEKICFANCLFLFSFQQQSNFISDLPLCSGCTNRGSCRCIGEKGSRVSIRVSRTFLRSANNTQNVMLSAQRNAQSSNQGRSRDHFRHCVLHLVTDSLVPAVPSIQR